MSTNTFLFCISVGPSLNQAEAIVSQSLALHKLVKSERCASFDRKKAFLSKLLCSHLDEACDDYLFPTSAAVLGSYLCINEILSLQVPK